MSTLQERVAALLFDETNHFSSNNQSTHRLNILQSWLNIAQEHNYDLESNIIGRRTLDIGCGQGDMIEVFAASLKAQGNDRSKVIGVDPADLGYGSPCTLGEAQSKLSTSGLSQYLSFEQTTAPAFVVSQPAETYTTAYFAHSLYYFPSTATLTETFESLLNAGVQTLLLAEWSLSISRPPALSHLLAVLLQSIDPLPDGNVRTVSSPSEYIDAASQAGWELVGFRTFTPAASLEDGKWEAGMSLRRAAEQRGSVESVPSESIRAHIAALETSMASVDSMDRVECMDVWTAVLRPAQATPSNQK